MAIRSEENLVTVYNIQADSNESAYEFDGNWQGDNIELSGFSESIIDKDEILSDMTSNQVGITFDWGGKATIWSNPEFWWDV